MWALPELIEAAARTGNPRIVGDALDLLTGATRAGGTDFGLGIEARSRALLSDAEAADGSYCEAIDRLSSHVQAMKGGPKPARARSTAPSRARSIM